MSADVEHRLRRENDTLLQVNATLRRALVDHPAAQTVRYLAPFIRAAIEAGLWAGSCGPANVEHEIKAALAWLDREEAAATTEPAPTREPVL